MTNAENVYSFSAPTPEGPDVPLETFRGKVLLIVNTASQCGYTPQYEGLQVLYGKYEARGLVVLGFPCNQFGGQEPGDASVIQNFCSLTYAVRFPIFAKTQVNGPNQLPLYKFLKQSLPGILGTEAVKWNFTKFLVNREGVPVERFGPQVVPADLEPKIVAVL